MQHRKRANLKSRNALTREEKASQSYLRDSKEPLDVRNIPAIVVLELEVRCMSFRVIVACPNANCKLWSTILNVHEDIEKVFQDNETWKE